MRYLFIILSLLTIPSLTYAEDVTLKGTVINVHDGDTLKVEIECPNCPPLFKVWNIRVLGIDTPELKSQCENLKKKAFRARDITTSLCPVGSPVLLMEVDFDKFGNRLDSNVQCVGGNIADVLKQAKVAKDYHGIGPKPWNDETCQEGE